MERKNRVYSLFFPVMTVIGGVAGAVLWWPWPSVIIMAVGLLAVILTVGLRIDTSHFFKIRSLFFVLSLLTFVLPVLLFHFFSGDGARAAFSYFLLYFFILAPIAAFLAEMICLVKLRAAKKPGAFAVMLLSDQLACNLFALAWSFISLCITGF